MITLAELKQMQLILRLPSSATRELFESTLLNDIIQEYQLIAKKYRV